MNEISLPKKIGCIFIALAISFITFCVGVVGDLSLMYFAMFLTIPTYSAMFLTFPNYMYSIFPLISSIGIYLVTGKILNAVFSIMFLILASLCAEGVFRKRTKYNTIVRMSVVMFFAFLMMFALSIYSTYGELSREVIVGFAEELFDILVEYISSSLSLVGEELEAYKLMIIELSYVSLGSFLFLFVILSYISCTFSRKIVYWFNPETRLFNFDNLWEFEMPIESAYIYIISYAFLFVIPLAKIEIPAVEVAIYAVVYPLMAGMIVSGIKQIKQWLKEKHTGKGLFIGLIVLGFLLFSSLVLSVTGFIGVYRCFSVNKETKWNVEK